MIALRSRCGHYIFVLFLLSFFFFSSSNLSGRRLDVYHTSTYGLALARIQNAGLKCKLTACGSLKILDAKNRQKLAISALSHNFVTLYQAVSSQVRHISIIGKKPVKQQYLLNMPSQYGELRPTKGCDLLASLGYPCKFQRVYRLGSVTARHSSTGRQSNFAALNTGRHLYSAGRPSRWALAHISSFHKISQVIRLSQPLDSLIKLWYKCSVLPDRRISCLLQICTIL